MPGNNNVESRAATIGASAFATLPWGQLRLISSIAFLSVAAMMNIAPLLPLVKSDLNLTDTWSALLTSATILTHTLLQLPGGQVTDSLGARRTVQLGVTIMGLAVIATALAPNVPLLLLSRMLIGVGTSLSFVAGLTFTNQVVPADRRVLGQSVFGATASLGILTVLLFSEQVAAVGGWRGTFMVEGIAILIFGWYVALNLRGDGARRNNVSAPWAETVRRGTLYLLGVAHVITYGIFIGVTTWVVTFLFRNHGVGLEWAGPLSALFTISAIVGRLIGGAYSMGRERSVIIWSCLVSAITVGLIPIVPGLWAALLMTILFGWFVSVPFGAIFSYASLTSHRPASGRELSLINFIANIGALVFPPVVGSALDLTGSFTVGFGILALAGLAGSAALVAFLPQAR